ncbi:MAG: quinone oxidoreductase [Thermoleophilia bacterium]
MKSKAVLVRKTGGPDALEPDVLEVEAPAAGEVRVRQEAIGVNFIDVYQRRGLYPLATPFVPGQEAAGVVDAVGEGVTEFKPGDRVGYAGEPGAYTEIRNLPADRVVRLPEGVDTRTAAGLLLRGMTVEYLIRRTFPVEPGMTVLWHAAAGGVGLIACQWLAHLGVTVIGTAGGREKAELARQNGCTHIIDYREEDFVARVRELTGGKGVPVVYDSVGKDTFEGSLACLSRRGYLVTFGNASGPPPAVDPLSLAARGSLYMTRPRLGDYTATRSELTESAEALLSLVATGVIQAHVGQEWPLDQAAEAHRALEGRRTTGSTLLIP